MVKNIILIGFFFYSASCSVRVEREPISHEDALVGSWQHVYDREKIGDCNPNIDCKCVDMLNFYQSGAFDRNIKCDYKRGTYTATGKKLRLVYVSEYPQVFDYQINPNELVIVKENVEHLYVRKPFKVRMDK